VISHRLYYLVLTIALCARTADGQWVQTNGPFGGQVSCFAVMGTYLFAGTNGGGVYRSTDGGASWTQVNNGITEPCIETFAVSGSKLFVGTTYFTGVFVSSDSGATWTSVNSGMHGSRVEALAVSDSHMFAGTAYYGGLFHSTNDGSSWTQVDSNLFDSDVRALSSAPAADGTGGRRIFAATDNGVYVSQDNASSWTRAGSLGLVNVFAVSTAFGGSGQTSIFAGTWSSGVFRSTDDGATWTAINTGLPAFPNDVSEYCTVWSLVSNGQTLLAGIRDRGIYRSTDGGASWSEVNSGLTDFQVYALAVTGSNLLAGTDVGGVFLSTDNGTSWDQANDGLHQVPITSLAVAGGTIFAGALRGGVFRSTDNGASWMQVNSGLASPGVNSLVVAPSVGMPGDTTVFAGTYDGLFRSANAGTAWTRTDAGLTGLPIRTLAASVDTVGVGGRSIYAGTGNGAFRSTDGGASWMDVSPVSNDAVNAFAISGSNLFAGTQKGRVFRSTNNGASWTSADVGLSAPNGIKALVANDTVLFAGSTGGTQCSTNNGETWNEGSYDAWYCQAFAMYGTTVFAGSWNANVFYSTNNGILWRDAGTGLKNTQVNALAVLGSNLFAGTNAYGVWRRPIAEMITSVEQMSAESPQELRLWQNYPNPFNAGTVIGYRVQGIGYRDIRLAVYDLLGREVAVLVNEKKAPGDYEVKFDGSSLSSGVYFYRMQVDDFVQTRRLLMLK
jgi:photosystem II stability/assembly factor-like uncharacterized protein